MNELNFIFVWIAGFAVLSNATNVTEVELIDGKNVRRWNLWMAALLFLPVFWIACFGTPRGDTWLYISNFEKLSVNRGEFLNNLKEAESGQGFIVLQFAIKKLFGNSVDAFRIILALIHSIPLIFIFRRYSESYLMTIFLFVASGCHVGWMMNGIRQFVAVVIIVAATPLLLQQKYLPMVAVILFASTFHVTALLMLPIIFIVHGKAWNEKTIFYIVVALVAMFFFDKYTGVLDLLLEGTEFEGATNTWREMGDDGTNPIRVLVNAIPMLLSFLGRNHIKYEKDMILNVCVNMSVVTTGLYLISMVTSGIMIGRLPIYTSLFNLILLPNLITKMFTEESVRMVRLAMAVFYILYYIIEVGF